MVVLLSTAAMWTEERSKKAGYITEGKCLLCNEDVEDTVFHTVWECEAVQEAGLEEVTATKGMESHAKAAGKTDREVFWSRGLVPWDWMSIAAEPEEACIITWGPTLEVEMENGSLCTTELTCYLDESGGVHARDAHPKKWVGVSFPQKTKRGYEARHGLSGNGGGQLGWADPNT